MERRRLLPEARRPSFYIIDGQSQMYRALFSPSPRLTSPRTGEPTAGTFIFTKMLLKLAREKKPDFLAMTLDGPRKELERRKRFPPYKTKRATQTDPDFFLQVDRMIAIARLLGIPVIEHKGWESDDIVASLVAQYGQDKDCYLVTKDKDFHQLVDEHVVCYDPQKEEFVKVDDVLARWDVECPSQVLEIQTLMGDTTDDVPGVEGIGEVRAKALIKQYGTARAVFEALKHKPDRIGRGLASADLDLCRFLVRLNPDLDLGIDASLLKFRGLKMEAAAPLFSLLGFKRFVEPAKDQGLWSKK